MAWARDIETGEPRYILELDESQRGAKCGSECPSCALPLTAVNAAKTRFIRRPHFRHPDGAARNECSILAARAAALRLLIEDGLIELPRRRMSGTVTGLSGQRHTAWVEVRPQRVRIANVSFNDRAAAVLTLEGGRTLQVMLTGTAVLADDYSSLPGEAIPTILIDINDASIAGMDPPEIRKRLQLLPDNLCWRSHWDDDALRDRAVADARRQADDLLDWSPDDKSVPEGLSPELKRETLLHREVKRIVEEAAQITVPGASVVEELRAPGYPTLQRRWSIGEHVLRLLNPRLEHRMGRVIPDLVCEAHGDGGEALDTLLVEVTVTNPIDDERLQRIRSTGYAALEIDLSLTGGLVTRSELRRLVIHDVGVKRWLNHSGHNTIREDLRQQLRGEHEARVNAEVAARDRHRRIMEAPIGRIAETYLSAVKQMLLEQENGMPPKLSGSGRSTLEEVEDCVHQMKLRGYPEAGDQVLLGYHGVLSRLLSIQNDRGIGYRYDSGMGVLNAVRQSTAENRHDWTLYLIAAKVYRPSLAEGQRAWLNEWRQEVTEAISRDDETYLRHAHYDRILSVLFPKMASALASPKGKRQRRAQVLSPPRRPAAFLTSAPRHTDGFSAGSQDRRDWFLRGAALAAWKQRYPESAAAWEQTLKQLDID